MSGKIVPHSVAKAIPTSKRLLSKKMPSREITESNSGSGRSLGKRKMKSAVLKTMIRTRKARKWEPMPEEAKEWNELRITLRTSKSPKMERTNVVARGTRL